MVKLMFYSVKFITKNIIIEYYKYNILKDIRELCM